MCVCKVSNQHKQRPKKIRNSISTTLCPHTDLYRVHWFSYDGEYKYAHSLLHTLVRTLHTESESLSFSILDEEFKRKSEISMNINLVDLIESNDSKPKLIAMEWIDFIWNE